MDRIIIPGMDHLARMERRAYHGLASDSSSPRSRTDHKAPRSDEPHPVLAGLGARYNSPLILNREICMFAPGAFTSSLASGRCIRLQDNHNPMKVLATTDRGLELLDSDDGLLFWIKIRDVKNGATVARWIEDGSRSCVSVGGEIVASRNVKYGDHSVKVISDVRLSELSLVQEGAVERAFAFLTNDSLTPSIQGMRDSTIFALASAVHRVTLRDKRAKWAAQKPRAEREAAADLIGSLDRLVSNMKKLKE
jgi:HK97 family phage prohead protease